MSLVETLMATRGRLRMAKELAQLSHEHAALQDRAGKLEHDIFWLRAAENREIRRLQIQLAECREDLESALRNQTYSSSGAPK